MSVVGTTQDLDALTLTVVAEFAAPPARVWQVWSDPRQLEGMKQLVEMGMVEGITGAMNQIDGILAEA